MCINSDFEAFLEDVETCFPDPNKSSVSCNTKFEACSYGHQIICSDERYTKSLSFAQVQTQFSFYFRKLPRRGIKTKEFFRKNCPMIMPDPNKDALFRFPSAVLQNYFSTVTRIGYFRTKTGSVARNHFLTLPSSKYFVYVLNANPQQLLRLIYLLFRGN